MRVTEGANSGSTEAGVVVQWLFTLYAVSLGCLTGISLSLSQRGLFAVDLYSVVICMWAGKTDEGSETTLLLQNSTILGVFPKVSPRTGGKRRIKVVIDLHRSTTD